MRLLEAIRRRWRRGQEPPAHGVWSFAQEGEDRILERFLGSSPGFYVDVGAHHPQRFSNTYGLYLKGWRGINIEPTPGAKAVFDRVRPRDVNLEVAAGAAGEQTLYRFADEALNTLDPDRAAFLESAGIPVTARCAVASASLADILTGHLPPETTLNLLNVDAEGRDLDVLHSNDWQRFRPDWVVVEVLRTRTVAELQEAEISRYLSALGYRAVAKTFNTAFFEWA